MPSINSRPAIFALRMKNFAILLLCLAFGAVQAQENINQTDDQGRKHGVWKKYYDNDQLRYEGRFNHGVEVDTFKFYFEDGNLRAKNYFRKKGVVYSWQYGGDSQLAAEGKYLNTRRDSVWTFYDMDGNILSRESYENDLRDGQSVTYFDNGKKAEILHYKAGKRNGEWRQNYETGKPKAKGHYVNGMLEGEVTYFHPTGKPRMKGNYRRGKMHGVWYYFDEFMQVEKKEEWRYGLLVEDEKDKEDAENEE
jgi:antitoxin component YwqK of YwqJK toxin-antitoxin module